MGNADKTIVFNDSHVFTIKGQDYTNDEGAVRKAIDMFFAMAKNEADEWIKTRKENPEMVDPDFSPSDYFVIKTMRVF
jgi:hypothetical protein